MINYYSTSLKKSNGETTFFLRLEIRDYWYLEIHPKHWYLFLLDLSEIIT